MKKIVVIIFFFMMIFTISSCEFNSYSKNPKEGFYELIVTSEVKDMITLPKNGYYKAGTTLKLKTLFRTDVSLYLYLNNEQIRFKVEDEMFVCSFEMPQMDSTIHITMNEFYGKDDYTFRELFYWVDYLNEENVIKIREKSGYYGVSPENFTNISYTENHEDIKNILTIFNQPLKIVEDEQVTGGWYKKYRFYRNDGLSYELDISNGIIVLQYFNAAYHFKFDNTDFKFPEMKNKSNEYYSFNSNYEAGKIYSYSYLKELSRTFSGLDLIEFKLSEFEIIEEAKYCIKYSFGDIDVIDAKTFLFDGKYYIVGEEFDFSSLF